MRFPILHKYGYEWDQHFICGEERNTEILEHLWCAKHRNEVRKLNLRAKINNLRKATTEQFEDVHFLITAISEARFTYGQHVRHSLRSSRHFIIANLLHGTFKLKHLTAAEREDEEFVYAALQNNGQQLQYAPDHMKADPRIVASAYLYSSKAIQFASAELQRECAGLTTYETLTVLRTLTERRPIELSIPLAAEPATQRFKI